MKEIKALVFEIFLFSLFQVKKPLLPVRAKEVCGGAGGIRTHGTIAGTPDFESGPL